MSSEDESSGGLNVTIPIVGAGVDSSSEVEIWLGRIDVRPAFTASNEGVDETSKDVTPSGNMGARLWESSGAIMGMVSPNDG